MGWVSGFIGLFGVGVVLAGLDMRLIIAGV